MKQLRIRYGSTEHTRFTSDFVGINNDNPNSGLTINFDDYWDTNGNTYWIPEGKIGVNNNDNECRLLGWFCRWLSVMTRYC